MLSLNMNFTQTLKSSDNENFPYHLFILCSASETPTVLPTICTDLIEQSQGCCIIFFGRQWHIQYYPHAPKATLKLKPKVSFLLPMIVQLRLPLLPLPPQLHIPTTITTTMCSLTIVVRMSKTHINHRGSDVKNTFASHLYRRLVLHGFRVFLDKQELQEGDSLTSQIQGAIRTASVQIAVFSPNYAGSSWCLDELLLILKTGATIIPVFYNVKPSDLRRRVKNGLYAQALEIHEKNRRYDFDTIENWRKALSAVADISGLELEACKGDEGELVDKVVHRVETNIRKTPLNVATYPTGLKEKVEELERTVLSQQQMQQNGKAKVVGIVGLGGIGKTTLAKEFFNSKRSDYERSCFLFDVRGAATGSYLNSLQSKLLKDLARFDLQIGSIDEGIEMLKIYLSSCQALIVLDDVDHVQQLDALLLPLKEVLPPGSLILVTSRDKDVLTSAGIIETYIYKLAGLNRQQSKELFCWHAFHQSHPVVEFEHVVAKFLDACDGLPLSLKVIGALLHGKNDLGYWKAQLNKISDVLPTDIQSRIKISYDSLDEQEKEIFLDIACFFIGENKDTTIRIWDGSGWAGSLGFRNLENKCLVEVDSKNCIKMHYHIRDLGRVLAEKEPPGCLRRLWRPTDNLHNVFDQTHVRGISMVQQISGLSFNNPVVLGNRFIDMSRLQLLRAEGDCLKRIFSPGQSPPLVWLSWHQCPYSSLPSWIPTKNLRVLEVSGSELETLWQSGSEAPLQLRELNIRAGLLQFPKFIGQLKHLEKIVLVDTLKDYIETLPEELFHLSSLKHLRICTNMKSLPNSFGNLTNLQHIDLSGCSKLQTLPHSFRNLVQLKHLCLAACFELTMSNEVLGNISTLESLDLSDGMKMEVLPHQITHQRSLEEMCLLSTNLKELPSAIGGLISLEILKLGSPLLETLPPSLGELTSLKELTLSGCSILKCMPNSIGELKQLRKLQIEYSGIEYLPIGVTEMNNLEILKVHTCPLLELPFASVEMVERGKTALTDLRGHRVFDSDIDRCMLALKYLELHCTIVSEVSFPKGVCSNLEHLKIRSCNDLLEVGALPSTLVTLEFSSCCALKKIGGLWGLANLRQLDISGSKELEELPSLETLDSLEELRASECAKLKSIRGLAQLTKLRILDVKEYNDIEEIQGVEKLRSLQKFNSFGCSKLQQDVELMQLSQQVLSRDGDNISISDVNPCNDSIFIGTENNTNNSCTRMEIKTDKKRPIIQKIATTHLWLHTKMKRIQMCKGICGCPCNQREISNNQ